MRTSTRVLMIALLGLGWGGSVQEVNAQHGEMQASGTRRSVSDNSMNRGKTLPAIYPSSSIASEGQIAAFSTASHSTPSRSGNAVQLASYANQEFQNDGFVNYNPGYSGSSSCTSSQGCCEPCCEPWWAHSNSIFGESLYLWPGNSDLIYATEKTGTSSTDSPTGPLGITNVDESVGFRVGFSKRRTQCSSFFASYARWDGETTDSISTTNRVLISNLIHPSTTTVGSQSLTSSADQSISFQVVDAGFRRILRTTNCSALNWSAGLRYGNLEQGLTGRQIIQTATGLTTVNTDIDFDGVGILLGADGERRSQCCGGLIYGKLLGSLLAGDWRADFRQTNQFGGGVIANHFEDFRVTPVFDAELGFGWVSKSGAIKLTAGYLFSNWFNSISTRDYLRNVRSGALEDMADVLTFSGLTSRLELKF